MGREHAILLPSFFPEEETQVQRELDSFQAVALPLPGLLPCALVPPRMELSNPRQGPGLLTAPIDHTVISDHRTERPEFLGTLPLLTAPPPQNPGANPAALSPVSSGL